MQSSSEAVNSSRMGKKSKKTVTPSASPATGQPIADPGTNRKGLISNSTCLGLGKTTWLRTYNLIEAEEPEVTTMQATVDTTRKSDATLKDLADSFLHRIATREQILPYTDVVSEQLKKSQSQTEHFVPWMGESSVHFNLMI